MGQVSWGEDGTGVWGWEDNAEHLPRLSGMSGIFQKIETEWEYGVKDKGIAGMF